MPPWKYVLKDALNHFLVHSRVKSSLRSAKNVVFSLFSILADRLYPPAGYATVCELSFPSDLDKEKGRL